MKNMFSGSRVIRMQTDILHGDANKLILTEFPCLKERRGGSCDHRGMCDPISTSQSNNKNSQNFIRLLSH
jgi:hypothetical protein